MRKKSIVLALLLCFSLLLSGCTGNAPESSSVTDDGKPNVIATIFPAYDMTCEIAGDTVNLSLLVPPGADAHTFDLQPEDLKQIEKADVFIYTGDEMEPWVKTVREKLEGKDGPLIIDLSQHLNLAKPAEEDALGHYEHNHDGEEAHEHEHDHDGEEAHEHEHDHDGEEAHEHEHGHDGEEAHEHEHDHDGEEAHEHEHDHDAEEAHGHEGHHHSVDPHIWTSLRNAVKMSNTIAEGLSQVNPDKKEQYQKNAGQYKGKLNKLDGEFKATVAKAKRHTIVVADSFPFLYFVRDYHLDFIAAVDSCDEHAEPSARRIAEMQDYIKAEKIPIIYYTELAEPKVAKRLAEATGAKTMLLNAAHTVSIEDLENGKSYLDIMTDNLEALKKGLE